MPEGKAVYRIQGTSREVGAIGVHEPFDTLIPADSPYDAVNHARIMAYRLGREHVQVTAIDGRKPTLDEVIL